MANEYATVLNQLAPLAEQGQIINLVVAATLADGRVAHVTIAPDAGSYALLGLLDQIHAEYLSRLTEAKRIETAMAQRDAQIAAAKAVKTAAAEQPPNA